MIIHKTILWTSTHFWLVVKKQWPTISINFLSDSIRVPKNVLLLIKKYIKYYRKLFNLALPTMKLDVPLLFHEFIQLQSTCSTSNNSILHNFSKNLNRAKYRWEIVFLFIKATFILYMVWGIFQIPLYGRLHNQPSSCFFICETL